MLFLQVMYLILNFSDAHEIKQNTLQSKPQLQNTLQSSEHHVGIRCNPSSYFQQICPTGDLCRNDGSLVCGKDVYHNVAYCLCPAYDHQLHGSRPVKCNRNYPQVCPTGHLCSPKILRCDNLGSCTCPQYRDFHTDEVDDFPIHVVDDIIDDPYDNAFFDENDKKDVIFDPNHMYDYYNHDDDHDHLYYDENDQAHYPNDLDDHLYRYDGDTYPHDYFNYDDDYLYNHPHYPSYDELDQIEPDHHGELDLLERDLHRHCNPNADFVSLCPSGHECRSDILECAIDSYFNVEYCECPLESVKIDHPSRPRPEDKNIQQPNEVHCNPNSPSIQVCPSGHLCSRALECVERPEAVSFPREVHCNPYQGQFCPNGVQCNAQVLDCEPSLDGRSIEYCKCPVVTHNIAPSLTHPSIDYCICPSDHTNVPSHHTNVPSQHTNVPSQHTNVPSQPNQPETPHYHHHYPENVVVDTPSQHTNVPSQHTNVPSHHTNVPSHHTNVPSHPNVPHHHYPENVLVDPYHPEHNVIIDTDYTMNYDDYNYYPETDEFSCESICDAGDSEFRKFLKGIRLTQVQVSSTNLHVLRQEFMDFSELGCGCDPSCVHFKDCCGDYSNYCEQP